MSTALVLVDLQADFLSSPGLEPAAGELIDRAAALLAGWRRLGEPVIHVITTVNREDDRRMPHWRAAGLWRCEGGTPGHAPPPSLSPRDGEPVVHKTDFNGFQDTTLAAELAGSGATAVVLAGTHMHACVRATALGAYARRLDVTIAADAVASDDPLHAGLTRAWMQRRGVRFVTVNELLADPRDATHGVSTGQPSEGEPRRLVHARPADSARVAVSVVAAGPDDIQRAAAGASAAAPGWAEAGGAARVAIAARLAQGISAERAALTQVIVDDVGKPITQAAAEVDRTVALLEAICMRGDDTETLRCGPNSTARQRPLGAVALVTPWNNPLAIPVGKFAPALVYGNTVVWKPALAGWRIAELLMGLATQAGLPDGVMSLLAGDEATAAALMADSGIDAVTVTGGAGLGWAASAISAQRGVPLQTELGGNNPTLVAGDADLSAAAQAIAAGAFEFAGQRCTAGRRVIVERSILEPFCVALEHATGQLAWGPPEDPATAVGPLISPAARRRVDGVVRRALAAGALRLTSEPASSPAFAEQGSYLAPVVLRCDDPAAEVVQKETFGPVLVVQPADDWTHAIALANGVRQGLVAAAFTRDASRERQFLRDVRAGILKLGVSTAGADVEAPFGGWKQSGAGPPEHGISNRDFYTRRQAVYR